MHACNSVFIGIILIACNAPSYQFLPQPRYCINMQVPGVIHAFSDLGTFPILLGPGVITIADTLTQKKAVIRLQANHCQKVRFSNTPPAYLLRGARSPDLTYFAPRIINSFLLLLKYNFAFLIISDTILI